MVIYCLLFWKLKNIYLVGAVTIYSVTLIVYLYTTHRLTAYGLCRIREPKFYLIGGSFPFIAIILCNLYMNFSDLVQMVGVYDIILVFFCAFIEELFFRGWFFSKFDVKNYVIISSVLFAVSHILNLFNGSDVIYTIFQVLWAFCMGISFALLRLISGSIIPGVIYHYIINMTSLGQTNVFITELISTLIIAVFCMIYLMIIYYKLTKEKRAL